MFSKNRSKLLFPKMVVSALVGLVLLFCQRFIWRLTGPKF